MAILVSSSRVDSRAGVLGLALRARSRAELIAACVLTACLVLLGASPVWAAARPVKRYCGRIHHAPVSAYNLSCPRAIRIWTAASTGGGTLPAGWTGANVDRAGGEALLFPAQDFDRIVRAETSSGLDLGRLGRVPVVLARVPYGE